MSAIIGRSGERTRCRRSWRMTAPMPTHSDCRSATTSPIPENISNDVLAVDRRRLCAEHVRRRSRQDHRRDLRGTDARTRRLRRSFVRFDQFRRPARPSRSSQFGRRYCLQLGNAAGAAGPGSSRFSAAAWHLLTVSIASLYGGAGLANFPYFDIFKLRPLTSAAGVVVNTQFANDLAGTYRTREDTAANLCPGERQERAVLGNAGLRYVVHDRARPAARPERRRRTSRRNRSRIRIVICCPRRTSSSTSRTISWRVFAFSKTFSRQKFADLKVSSAVDLTTVPSGVLTITRGNPNLKPFTANSFDLSLEWYPDKATGISVAVYAKSITNFLISTTEVTNVTLANGTSVPAQIITTVNDPRQRYLRGVELQHPPRSRLPARAAPQFGRAVQHELQRDQYPTDRRVAGRHDRSRRCQTNSLSSLSTGRSITAPSGSISASPIGISTPNIRAFFGSYQEQPKGQFDVSGGYTIINVRPRDRIGNQFVRRPYAPLFGRLARCGEYQPEPA